MSDVVLESARARLVVRPERGGMITDWSIDGRPMFYMDADTLADPTKNVRGGNPVLFPSPGKLANDAWARGGASGAMKQHGFARNLPWRVVGTLGGAAPAVMLELASDATTLAQYPWPCTIAITYGLRATSLRIDIRVTNTGDTAMPFGVGFHPYFHVPQADKLGTRATTDAREGFDNVTKTRGPLPRPISFDVPELDLHLLGTMVNSITLAPPKRSFTFRASPEFTHWVLWTVAGKDFVCAEPWTAPGDALNTGDRVIELAPGASRDLWVDVEAIVL